MIQIINRKVDYPLNRLLGFELGSIPLESTQIPNIGSSLTLLSTLFADARPNLTLTQVNHTSLPDLNKMTEHQAQNFESRLHKLNIPIKVGHTLVNMIGDDLQQLLQANTLPILNDQYVFIKNAERTIPKGINDSVFELRVKNLIPVLVFPEQDPYFNTKIERLDRLFNRGTVFQIDWLSLSGFNGHTARKTSLYLLENKLVKFIGFENNSIDQYRNIKVNRIDRKAANLLDNQLL